MKILGVCYTANISRLDVLPVEMDIFCIKKKLDGIPLYKHYSKTKFFHTFKNIKLNVFTKLLHGLNVTFNMLKLVKQYDYFIFVTPPYFHFLSNLIITFLGKRSIALVADAYYHITKDKSFDTYWLYALRKVFSPLYLLQEYVAVKYSSAVFTNSFFVYNTHKRWNANTYYTPNGADVKTINKTKSKKYVDTDYIIYIGSFSPFRGLDILIEAFKILKTYYKKPLKLVIIGKYEPYKNSLKKLISEEKDIMLESYVKIPELYSYVKSAKIGIIPNHDTITSRTISSNKGFIYIGAEVPQIVTDSGDHSYWTKKLKTGLVVSPNPEDMAKAMFSLLINTQLYNNLRKNCKLNKHLVDYLEVKKPLINYLKKITK
ncbi:glycosyltransferase [Candidatus Woesearchaeota archaeon]|nr:glycosyltransferase [Candidatus Woesearchaeota archaeon]